jgi:hypothetical protein
MTPEVIIIIILTIITLTMSGFLLRLTSLYKKLSDSFHKLGFLIREDAKSYFEKESEEEKEISRDIVESNMHVVKRAIAEVIAEERDKLNLDLENANQHSQKIILEAKAEAKDIKDQAASEGREIVSRSRENAVNILEKTMKDFQINTLDIKDHEQMIEKLLDKYFENDKK